MKDFVVGLVAFLAVRVPLMALVSMRERRRGRQLLGGEVHHSTLDHVWG